MSASPAPPPPPGRRDRIKGLRLRAAGHALEAEAALEARDFARFWERRSLARLEEEPADEEEMREEDQG